MVRLLIKLTTESMDRLATLQGQKLVEITVRFPKKKRMIKFLDRLTIIQDQKIVETTVRFSIRQWLDFQVRIPLNL